MNPYLATLVVYSIILVGMGLFLARKVQNTNDFFVAGRKLNTTLLFSTILAANIGAGSTVVAAGLGYSIGLSAWWWVGSAGIGSIILALSVGPKIRDLAAQRNFLTVGDFLEYRYSPSTRATIAILLWFGTLSILAGQLIAIAFILNVVADIPKAAGCLIGGTVVVLYFSTGGLKGTVWINLLQLIVKGLGFLISLPLVLASVGSFEGLNTSLMDSGKSTTFLHFLGTGWSDVLPYVALLVPSFIISPGLLQKIFGARDARTVRLGVGLNGVVLLVYSFFPVLFGMVAASEFPNLAHKELALPTVITEMLPIWLGALLLASIFSAEVSSSDAILFMLSTSLSKDLYKRYLNPDVSDHSLLQISRKIAFTAGIMGILLAIILESAISALSIFYSLMSVALFAPLIIGLYRKIPGKNASLAAISISLVGTLAIYFLTRGDGVAWLSPTAFGIAISMIVMLIAGLRRQHS